jgi:N-carbamoyl-L-amino-acid hydrolase
MSAPGENLRINSERLWDSLMDMAKIGPGIAGGNNRQHPDRRGRRRAASLFKRWCDAAGLDDGRRRAWAQCSPVAKATDPGCAAGVCRQPSRHPADGRQVRWRARRAWRPRSDAQRSTTSASRPGTRSSVANWTNEEGTRFAPAMLASGVFAGVLDLRIMPTARTDAHGARYRRRARNASAGWAPRRWARARCRPIFELSYRAGADPRGRKHIEIGVVTHGQGLWWLQVTLTGQVRPIPARRRCTCAVNAGLGMARPAFRAGAGGGHGLPARRRRRASATWRSIRPTRATCIAGRRCLHHRHPNPPEKEVLDSHGRAHPRGQVATDLRGARRRLRDRAGRPFRSRSPSIEFLRQGRARLPPSGSATATCDIVSGAGHDACWINRVAPTAMVFCPCVDGLSHNEDEEIYPEWAAAALRRAVPRRGRDRGDR